MQATPQAPDRPTSGESTTPLSGSRDEEIGRLHAQFIVRVPWIELDSCLTVVDLFTTVSASPSTAAALLSVQLLCHGTSTNALHNPDTHSTRGLHLQVLVPHVVQEPTS